MQDQAGNLDCLEEINCEALLRFLYLDKGWYVRTGDAGIGYTVSMEEGVGGVELC